MATIIELIPHLYPFFLPPRSSINIKQVAKAYVAMPLKLIKYMDILVNDLSGDDTLAEIKIKSEPAARFLCEKLVEAISSGSMSYLS